MRIKKPYPMKQVSWGPQRGSLSKIKALLAGSGLLILVVAAVPAQASAHVLVPDTTGKTGAILHVTPDDSPVAGQNTGIFYDVQTSSDLKTATAKLVITSDSGGIKETVPATISGHTVSAGFDFPIRGLYYLDLTITPASAAPITFKYSQRVTQSASGQDPAPATPDWARAGLLFSAWGFAALIIVAIRRRKRIIKSSK